jgi:hypothetical protein
MDDRQIQSEIAYLDDFPEASARRELISHDYIMAAARAAIRLEMAKQAYWPSADNVALRLTSLESRVEAMRHLMLVTHRGYPVVQYVSLSSQENIDAYASPESRLKEAPNADPPRSPGRQKFPKSLVVFYSLGLICSMGFAILLTLSAFGVQPIHPFLSLLGFVGGTGWLTTAWSDLLLLKAGKSWHHRTTTPTSRSSEHQHGPDNEHQQELAETGSR